MNIEKPIVSLVSALPAQLDSVSVSTPPPAGITYGDEVPAAVAQGKNSNDEHSEGADSQPSLERTKRGLLGGVPFGRTRSPKFLSFLPSGTPRSGGGAPGRASSTNGGTNTAKPGVADHTSKPQDLHGKVKKPTTTTPSTSATSQPAPRGTTTPATRFRDLAAKVREAKARTAKGDATLAKLKETSPISVAEATKRLMDAKRLVDSGAFSTSPSKKNLAYDAFISAGVTGMVSTPFNVAGYAGSVAAGEAIKATYVPGVLPPPYLPAASKAPAASTEPGAASESAKTEAVKAAPDISSTPRLDEAEQKVLGISTFLLVITTGVSDVGLTKDALWPKDDKGRLDNLEKLLDVSEKQYMEVAEKNGLLFKPHISTSTSKDKEARLDEIDKRYKALDKSVSKLIVLKSDEVSEAENNKTAIV